MTKRGVLGTSRTKGAGPPGGGEAGHSSSWRSDALVCAVLFTLAAAVRVLFLYSTTDRSFPFSVYYYGDSRAYREMALAFLAGRELEPGLPFHPPGFAWVLAATIGWLGERPTGVRAVLAVASSSIAPLVYLLAARLWSRSVGVVAAILVTFSFGACVAAVSANGETIYLPLLAAQVLALVGVADAMRAGRDRLAAGWSILSGLLLAAGALTRAEHLAFVGIVPAALWLGRSAASWRRWAAPGALSLGVACVALTPWILASRASIARFNDAHPALSEPLPTIVPVSGYGPLNFALANHAGSDGTFRPDALVERMGSGRLDLTDPRQAELYRHGYRLGLSFVAERPVEALRLAGRKLVRIGEGLALGFGAGNRPSGLHGERRPVDLFVPDRRGWALVALALALAGGWVSRREWRRLAPLWLPLVHVAAVGIAFFGYARFAVHVGPLLALLQASALVALVGRIPGARARRGVAASGLVVAALLLAELGWRARYPLDLVASGSADPRTGKIVQDASVRLAPRSAR